MSGDGPTTCCARAAWSALAEPGDAGRGDARRACSAPRRPRGGSARPRRPARTSRCLEDAARSARRADRRRLAQGASRGGPPAARTATRAATWSASTGSAARSWCRATPVAGRAGRPRRRGALLPVGPRGAADLGRALAPVGRRWSGRARATAYGDASRSTWPTGWPRRCRGGLRRGVRHRRRRAPRRRRRAAGRTRGRARGRGRPGLPGRQRPAARGGRRAGGASSSRGAAGQPADQEPVPAAQPADRRGGPRHGRGRGGVASGALSTAHHAARLLRPVGAVPGPVTSMASAGCHRLLREGVAVCVTDAAEVRELAGLIGTGRWRSGPPLSRRARCSAARRARPGDPAGARRAPAPDACPARPGGEHRGGDGGGGAGRRRLLELEGWAARRGDGWITVGATS